MQGNYDDFLFAVHLMNQRVDTGFQSARLHNDVQESAQGDDEHQQIGGILWLVVIAIAIAFTLRYAKKVKRDKGSTILSLQEQETMREQFGEEDPNAHIEFTGRHKAILVVFAIPLRFT